MEYDNTKLEWLEYDILAEHPNLLHATFLRHGGVSTNHFASLNLSAKVGDNPENVKYNREIVRKYFDVPHLIFAKQTHGIDVAEVTKDNCNTLVACDALITREPDIALVITHADCQGAIFYDTENHVVGVVHCGWKGLVKNIYAEVFSAFKEWYNTRPEKLQVAISPSLGPDQSEFKNYKTEIPEEYWSYQIKPTFFDLREIARKQLLDLAIPEENLEISPICTYQNKKDYFSYRRSKETGRHGTVVALKP